ncbi:hypothetical protein KP509_21G055500 [Ceratopteris richardii]|uniref:Uncharacterized protein n=1 Tax=Ceratopteris richardii TaxID=49495 RepID=A0A8T2SAL7_CERRI|nr:hypothetical protein KP509_21G055500 [Ceratopteris richardii]
MSCIARLKRNGSLTMLTALRFGMESKLQTNLMCSQSLSLWLSMHSCLSTARHSYLPSAHMQKLQLDIDSVSACFVA